MDAGPALSRRCAADRPPQPMSAAAGRRKPWLPAHAASRDCHNGGHRRCTGRHRAIADTGQVVRPRRSLRPLRLIPIRSPAARGEFVHSRSGEMGASKRRDGLREAIRSGEHRERRRCRRSKKTSKARTLNGAADRLPQFEEQASSYRVGSTRADVMYSFVCISVSLDSVRANSNTIAFNRESTDASSTPSSFSIDARADRMSLTRLS